LGVDTKRVIAVGAAIAIPLAAVALYFALFEPAQPPAPAVVRPGEARPDAGQSALPPDHPPVGGQTAGPGGHPQVGGAGRAVQVPDGVRGKWQAVTLQVAPKTGGAPQRVTVPLGAHAQVPGSRLTLKAEEFLPALQVKDNAITSASNDPANPAALVVVSEEGKVIFRGWLFAKFPDMQPFEHPGYRITLVEGVPKR
jgi:hypothetical protein